jgi:hypothetical protein
MTLDQQLAVCGHERRLVAWLIVTSLFTGLFSQGIFYSTDSGDSWVLSNLTNASVNQIQYNSNYMFAASSNQPGIFRSSDDGINWEHTSLNKVCWSVLVSGNNVIAGTSLEGVHVSTDDGLTWRGKNNNLASNNVFSLMESGEYVFSGLSGNGIYRITMSELTNSRNVNSEIPENYSLNQNYPNPFNPSTTISFNLQNREFINLKVYDLNGKLVRNLINDFYSGGSYDIIFDGSDLSSGIYYYSLTAGDFKQTKKMTLIK